MAPPRSQRKRALNCTGALVAAVGLGVTCWYLWKNYTGEAEGEQRLSREEAAESKCVVVTPSVCDVQNMVHWEMLINSDQEDIVFLVAPGCHDRFSSEVLSLVDEQFKYKAINCETVDGIWYCVKSLMKQQLYVIPSEVSNGIPNDIARYVQDIGQWRTREDILVAFPV
ncbi:ubiquitin-protein transferase activating protein PEX22 KNAG_0E00190 [Huiozyma naganishii CBS 8797]|uniref:Peroxisome assembly protein 22 n=1 Tax=Huiozyma naganishii (strain ATCC MYA-139 / BCRC 22969 / CBS 8797 / KCTC 17520 / NBRC 10181 / NCYC 3082 / Yp74L-3) TaxID=1071383 RepID=J7RYN7_HUIN7|nr:hypothetical protein KNAG_0E00190 [Kazachstania naganishii CBS 8797]CCK70287.1 hypothetical protein KNAG_0E00190 [Kazachstania naganishii CBS 8797]